MTTEHLVFSKLGQDKVIDHIPLHEIEKVSRQVDSDRKVHKGPGKLLKRKGVFHPIRFVV